MSLMVLYARFVLLWASERKALDLMQYNVRMTDNDNHEPSKNNAEKRESRKLDGTAEIEREIEIIRFLVCLKLSFNSVFIHPKSL